MLRKMPESELVELHDRLATNTSVGVIYYLDELARREAARSESRIECLTEKVRFLTVVVTILTAITTVASIVGMIASLRA